MAEPNKTEVTTAPETKPAAPESFDERLEKSVTEAWQRVATESAAESTEQPAEAQAAAQPDKPVETKPEEKKAEEPFTPEQLSDPKFWDGLDKGGWERAAKLHPVETARVKAAYQAAGRITEAARQQAPKPPAATASDKPTEKQTSPELQDAIRRANSIDDKEAASGLQDIVRLTLKDALPEFGFDPAQAKAVAVARTAYATAIAEMPEIANLDPNQLDATVGADRTLLALLQAADDLPDDKRVAITAGVMLKAAEAVMTKQRSEQGAAAAKEQAKVDKTKEEQRKVRSNASNVSNVIVESPAGGAPKPKRTLEEAVVQMWQEAATSEGH